MTEKINADSLVNLISKICKKSNSSFSDNTLKNIFDELNKDNSPVNAKDLMKQIEASSTDLSSEDKSIIENTLYYLSEGDEIFDNKDDLFDISQDAFTNLSESETLQKAGYKSEIVDNKAILTEIENQSETKTDSSQEYEIIKENTLSQSNSTQQWIKYPDGTVKIRLLTKSGKEVKIRDITDKDYENFGFENPNKKTESTVTTASEESNSNVDSKTNNSTSTTETSSTQEYEVVKELSKSSSTQQWIKYPDGTVKIRVLSKSGKEVNIRDITDKDYENFGFENPNKKSDSTSGSSTTKTDSGSTAGSNNTTGNSSTKNTSSEPKTDSAKQEATKNSAVSSNLSDNELDALAVKLHVATAAKLGTDEKTVNEIILNSNLTSDQLAKLSELYKQKYGSSLMHDIQKDFSGSAETKLRTTLYNNGVEHAKNKYGWKSAGDVDSKYEKLAGELYESMHTFGGKNKEMKELTNMSQEDIAKTMVAYTLIYGEDINTITKGNKYFGSEDLYVEKIIEALYK